MTDAIKTETEKKQEIRHPDGRFAPGNPGNPGGRPATKPFRDALLCELGLAPQNKHDKMLTNAVKAVGVNRLAEVVNALIARGADGNVQAIKELADRLDGKAAQEVNHTIEPRSDADDKALIDQYKTLLEDPK